MASGPISLLRRTTVAFRAPSQRSNPPADFARVADGSSTIGFHLSLDGGNYTLFTAPNPTIDSIAIVCLGSGLATATNTVVHGPSTSMRTMKSTPGTPLPQRIRVPLQVLYSATNNNSPTQQCVPPDRPPSIRKYSMMSLLLSYIIVPHSVLLLHSRLKSNESRRLNPSVPRGSTTAVGWMGRTHTMRTFGPRHCTSPPVTNQNGTKHLIAYNFQQTGRGG